LSSTSFRNAKLFTKYGSGADHVEDRMARAIRFGSFNAIHWTIAPPVEWPQKSARSTPRPSISASASRAICSTE